MANLPATMEVIEIERPGGAEMLVSRTRPVPRPAAGEILIKVAASGLNRADVAQRRGHYPPPPGASEIPGMEVSGEVVAIGFGAHGYLLGDRVCALLSGGGYAQYAAAPAVQCLPIPPGLTAVEAASLPEACFTVWTNVFDRAGCKAGDRVLIHGGASGIGVTAIQLAKAFGAQVFATAGSFDRAHFCESLGAARGINHKLEDFVEIVRTLTEGHGADIILDMVGGDYVGRNIAAAAVDGRIVNIAFLHGARAEIDLSVVMRKRVILTGSTLRSRSVDEKAAIARSIVAKVWPLIAQGKFRTVIHQTFPLAQAADAHRLMESGEHQGKIILTVAHD
jgi:putative PIG3 family NAD(P)H quinone oxidoreductase